ncbi:MAG: hypothetical protein DMF89_14530 [Acidobacteria bacterium]|nr:MAG: hypothetical protein DMF89_14530 [Acidobacteriota bacterium]
MRRATSKTTGTRSQRSSAPRATFVTLRLTPVSVDPSDVSDELVNSLADILADALVADILRDPIKPDDRA